MTTNMERLRWKLMCAVPPDIQHLHVTGPKTKSFQYVRFYFSQMSQLNTVAIKGAKIRFFW